MIRFYNGNILTFAGGSAALEGGELWTDGSEIVFVGTPTRERPVFEREIDLGGNLLLPGFKNAHTHSAMTFLRSYADDLPLQSWLFDKVFPLEARLKPHHIHALSKVAVMEYLTSGITACFDMYYHNDAFAAAMTECGFRAVLCGSVSGFDKDPRKLEDQYLKFNGMDPLISYKLGFHAEYTITPELMEYLAYLVNRYKAPIFSHNSETEREVRECMERHDGLTPTEYTDSFGLYEYGGGGFHCVHMSENDIEIFKKRGLWAITNPASNLKLASGVAPICRLLDAGVSLAIGTDGPASNNALDMFREMYLTTVLQKLVTGDAAACPAENVLKMACVGGAGAMGLSDCDCLAPGKQADLVVIDLSRPNMRPVNNTVKNIVYSGSKENVKLTMVAGKILYENGEFFIGESPDSVYLQAEAALRELTE